MTSQTRDRKRPGRALVLGAGPWQLDLIECAKRRSLWVLAADISPDAPGRKLADEFCEMDTNDRTALVDLARRAEIDVVLTDQTDRTVPVVAHLNATLGLPGVQPDVARRFTNKIVMRDALATVGVAMPAYAQVADLEAARLFAKAYGFPLVVKPLVGQASIDVRRVDDDAGLRAAFDTPDDPAPPRLVETFIEGTEVTVEGLTLGGETTVLAISEKRHYETHACVATQLAYPPRFPDDVLERIAANAAHVVECLGLVDGLSHGEYRVREGVPFLVEVAARGGGNRIASRIVPHVSGVDVYDLLIGALLGEQPSCPEPVGRAAVLEWLDVAPGLVRTAPHADELIRSGVISEAGVWFGDGDWIGAVTDDNARPGYFICLGDTRDQVDGMAAQARDVLSAVVYADDGQT